MEFIDLKCDYSLYKTFYVVAKSKSFSKAANILCLTQPTISYSINKLEKLLGLKLIIRNRHKMVITPEGTMLLEHIETAHNVLIDGEKNISNITNANKGELSIGMPVNYSNDMMNIIKCFKQKFPNIRINLILRSTKELIEMLNTYKVDLIFGFKDSLDNKKNPNNLMVCDLYDIELCFLSHENVKHHINNNLHFILPNPGTTISNHVQQYFDSIKLCPKVDFSTFSPDIILDLVRNDFGIGLFYFNDIRKLIEINELFEVKFSKPIPPIRTCYAYKNNFVNYTTKLFISFIKKYRDEKFCDGSIDDYH